MKRDLCQKILAEHPYPLMFATVSGAHLYGFPSSDSDYDLRGVHLLPVQDLLGLHPPRETVQSDGPWDGTEIDLVTHDAAKFFRMMLKRNGYVLEQLLSPIVIQTSPSHAELIALASGSLTKHHAHHYLGFAETQWHLFRKEEQPRVKPLLYVYRVLLTGIHLMRTGSIEANLPKLNDVFCLSYIPELIAQKTSGVEKQTLSSTDLAFHESEYRRLVAMLETERDRSPLPEAPTALQALNDLLLRVRLGEA